MWFVLLPGSESWEGEVEDRQDGRLQWGHAQSLQKWNTSWRRRKMPRYLSCWLWRCLLASNYVRRFRGHLGSALGGNVKAISDLSVVVVAERSQYEVLSVVPSRIGVRVGVLVPPRYWATDLPSSGLGFPIIQKFQTKCSPKFLSSLHWWWRNWIPVGWWTMKSQQGREGSVGLFLVFFAPPWDISSTAFQFIS